MDPLHPNDPPQVGRYRLIARLGSGGMGQVYLARTASGRKLVIKVIRSELASEAGFRARFAREAEAARRVGGFHTAQVVDADPAADPPWIATAHIPGLTLARAVREHGPLDPPALRILAAGLAEGLDAIHRCGLVHRDLKPANIILATDGPRIIDFGVARPMDADSMTTHGTVFGTLPYMSPEQTESSRVGPASDLFSLGTVLAFAATGNGPFSGGTMAETLRRLLSPPPDPGDIDPTIRALIQDCWNHDPDRRPTPNRILARFEANDLHTPRASPHFTRPASSTALPVVGATTNGPGGTPPHPSGAPASSPGYVGGRAPDPDPHTGTTFFRPDAARRGFDGNGSSRRRVLYIGAAVATSIAVVSALVLWRIDIGGSDPVAPSEAEGAAQPEDEEVEGTQWSNLQGSRTFLEGDHPVNALAFDSDGGLLAIGDDGAGQEGGNAYIKDVETGDDIITFDEHDGSVWSVAFSPDETVLATGDDAGTIRLWDIDSGEVIDEFQGDVYNGSFLEFSPDGTTLAANHRLGYAQLWDIDSGDEISFEEYDDFVSAVAFGLDSTILAIVEGDGSVQLWNADSGDHVTTLEEHEGEMHFMTFGPDDKTLATISDDYTVQLWNADSGDLITTLEEAGENQAMVAFAPDGATVAGSGEDFGVRLWDTDSGDHITTLEEHGDTVWSAEFSPDGTTLATAAEDGRVLLWDLY
ncbi:protein kinase [Nocardiopsis alba]|uniref:serine/threonine-protein kinase n=1 Tax=Nocardiopsis alba TaxID=53437 RepID=UPI0033B43FCD